MISSFCLPPTVSVWLVRLLHLKNTELQLLPILASAFACTHLGRFYAAAAFSLKLLALQHNFFPHHHTHIQMRFWLRTYKWVQTPVRVARRPEVYSTNAIIHMRFIEFCSGKEKSIELMLNGQTRSHYYKKSKRL